MSYYEKELGLLDKAQLLFELTRQRAREGHLATATPARPDVLAQGAQGHRARDQPNPQYKNHGLDDRDPLTAPDRHAARSRGDPDTPRAPGDGPLRAEPRSRPTGSRRRRVLCPRCIGGLASLVSAQARRACTHPRVRTRAQLKGLPSRSASVRGRSHGSPRRERPVGRG
jgi:hypothetical protein